MNRDESKEFRLRRKRQKTKKTMQNINSVPSHANLDISLETSSMRSIDKCSVPVHPSRDGQGPDTNPPCQTRSSNLQRSIAPLNKKLPHEDLNLTWILSGNHQQTALSVKKCKYPMQIGSGFACSNLVSP